MTGEVDPNEPLARYLLSRSHFSVQKRLVKSSAFMPSPTGELSVFRVRDLAEKEVWALGNQHVAVPQQRTLYGQANFSARIVTNAGLHVRPDDNPPRHADVVGWPVEKDAQKMVALELSQSATLLLKEDVA